MRLISLNWNVDKSPLWVDAHKVTHIIHTSNNTCNVEMIGGGNFTVAQSAKEVAKRIFDAQVKTLVECQREILES